MIGRRKCRFLDEYWPRHYPAIVLLMSSAAALAEQQVMPVWPGDAPGSEAWTHREISFYDKPLPSSPPTKMIRNVVKPTLTVYPARSTRHTGLAVIICPGGGFRILDWANEGTNVAEWLARHGVTAFVLKYRLVPTPEPPADFDKSMAEWSKRVAAVTETERAQAPKTLQDILGDEDARAYALAIADARQALKIVRQRAAQWQVAPQRIGLMGFSAGGFVATSVAEDHDPDSRPRFVAAIYGGDVGAHSVPADAAPLFAVVAQDDTLRMASVVTNLYEHWSAANGSAELHVFAKGGHGFGTTKQGLPVDRWLELFTDWLSSLKLPLNIPEESK